MNSNSPHARHQLQPKLLHRVNSTIRARHYSIRTEPAYVPWTKRFILLHNKCHPQEIDTAETNAFLSLLVFPASRMLLGHSDVNTTMIYTHVLKKCGKGICSPLDGLRLPLNIGGHGM